MFFCQTKRQQAASSGRRTLCVRALCASQTLALPSSPASEKEARTVRPLSDQGPKKGYEPLWLMLTHAPVGARRDAQLSSDDYSASYRKTLISFV